jgi:hypothetical protein
MIKFFRKIRQNLLMENKTGKYFKYAIGEIVLVVIGILIALSINNWNENRKADNIANKIYSNLISALEQDSIDVKRTITFHNKGLDALRKLIPLEVNEQLLALDEDSLNLFLTEVSYTGRSFIPQTGIYNLLVSSNGLELIKSNKIKALLVNLYDSQYKSYENLDARIDNKYHNQLGTVIRNKIGFIVEFNPEYKIIQKASPSNFQKHYNELSAESRDIYSMVSFSRMELFEIRESINQLMPLIRAETKK